MGVERKSFSLAASCKAQWKPLERQKTRLLEVRMWGGGLSAAENKDGHQPTAFRAVVGKSLTSTKPAKSSALVSLSFLFSTETRIYLIAQKYGF